MKYMNFKVKNKLKLKEKDRNFAKRKDFKF
jgi:hypothetical protein